MTGNQRERATKLIAKHFDVPERQVTMDAHFVRDFGADSLEEVHLVIALEDEFGIEITDEDGERCHRVGETLDVLAAYLS